MVAATEKGQRGDRRKVD